MHPASVTDYASSVIHTGAVSGDAYLNGVTATLNLSTDHLADVTANAAELLKLLIKLNLMHMMQILNTEMQILK